MNSQFSLKSLFSRFRGKISLTFLLLFTENVLNVLQPFAFGLAINDLLVQSFRGITVIIVLYACKLLVAVGRRLYDTRVYASIYQTMALEIIGQQGDGSAFLGNRAAFLGNRTLSATVARGNLVRELVDFFELNLTQGFTAAMSVIGAIVMLLIFDGYLFVGCLIAATLVYLVFWGSENRIFRLNQGLNNQIERQVEIVATGDAADITRHFRQLNRYRIQLSDLEAINFGLSESLLFLLVMFSLLVAALRNPSPGEIFAVLSYVIEFAEGIYALPVLFQQMIRVKEISSRLSDFRGQIYRGS
jgi:ABC-type multidrug transport system fused ATPase/permease subunit